MDIDLETIQTILGGGSAGLMVIAHLLAKFGNPYWGGLGRIITILAGNWGKCKNAE